MNNGTDRANGTVLLGLGNPILGDDGVGCRLADLIGEAVSPSRGVTILSTSFSPVRLLDDIAGHDRLLVIDSVTTGCSEPGTIHRMEPGDPVDDPVPISVHHLSIPQLLAMGRALGLHMPSSIAIYGIEIRRPEEYGDRLSTPIRERLHDIAEEIINHEFANPATDRAGGHPRGEPPS